MPGARVALDENEIAAVRFGRRVPEVHEAGIVELRRRLEARDMPAELGRGLVGLQDHRQGVPADRRLDRAFEIAISRMRRLLVRRNRIDVGGVGRERQAGTVAPRGIDRLRQHLVRPVHTLEGDDRRNRFAPFPLFVGLLVRNALFVFAGRHDRPGLRQKWLRRDRQLGRALPASDIAHSVLR